MAVSIAALSYTDAGTLTEAEVVAAVSIQNDTAAAAATVAQAASETAASAESSGSAVSAEGSGSVVSAESSGSAVSAETDGSEASSETAGDQGDVSASSVSGEITEDFLTDDGLSEITSSDSKSPENISSGSSLAENVSQNGGSSAGDSTEGTRLTSAALNRVTGTRLEEFLLSNMPDETREAIGFDTVTADADDSLTSGMRQYVVTAFTAPFPANEKSEANAKLAADYLNGTVIGAGENFSFNEALGERTKERGFVEAPVIWNDEVQQGVGGGICEISTMLYNICLQADLTVTERSPHTLQVPYVPGGLDAAVSWGTKDLRFRNPYDEPVALLIGYTDDTYLKKVSMMYTDGDDDTGNGLFVMLLVSGSGKDLLNGTTYVPVSEQVGKKRDYRFHTALQIWQGTNMTGQIDLGETEYEGIDDAE